MRIRYTGSYRLRGRLGLVVLLGVCLMVLPQIVSAQSSSTIVRPFYIGFKNSQGGIGCGQNLVLGEGNNSRKAFLFLIEYGGYSPEQAAGIVGNLVIESGVDPAAEQHGGPGRGIAQWETSSSGGSGRWLELEKFAEALGLDKWSLRAQLSFIIFELQGRPSPPSDVNLSGGWAGWGHDDLQATSTVGQASDVFMTKFERPRDQSEEAKRGRQVPAEETFEAYGDIATIPRDIDIDIRCPSSSLISYDINGCPNRQDLLSGGPTRSEVESRVRQVEADMVRISDSVGGGTSVHRCIKEVAEQLFIDINRDLGGISVSGGGWRSYDRQVALRTERCDSSAEKRRAGNPVGDYDGNGVVNSRDRDFCIYDRSAGAFAVAIARPGWSNHQLGLAIDFTANGGTICYPDPVCQGRHQNSHEEVFNWLTINAARYGFVKLNSEAWHWSAGGG